jgi:cytochrome bd-type quinol oxidase subunit 2
VAAARQRRQAELMPWTTSVAASAALLVATTVAFDVGAAALGWASWPWLFLFIPATGVSAAGVIATWNARYTTVGRPALATALFLAASVSAVLLVTHVMAGVAGVPVVAVTPLLGIALVAAQLFDEGDYRYAARQVEGRGRRARDGDG